MSTARWKSPEFRDELATFVEEAVGEPHTLDEVRLRPWSTVWRAQTPEGSFYVKENCVGQAHEAALLARLEEIAPGHVVPLVAWDDATGMLLTPDRGATLSERGELDVDAWCRVTSAAAQLQRAVLSESHSLGLTVMAPEQAPAYVARVTAELAALPTHDGRRISVGQRGAIEAALPAVSAAAEQLASLGLPLALNHNDLHADNVLEPDGRIVFFDLGDAVLDHPLAMLRVPLTVAAELLGAGDRARRLDRIVDAALDHWTDLATRSELRAALPAALLLARLARVESWLRCLASMSPDEVSEYGAAACRWLLTLRPDSP